MSRVVAVVVALLGLVGSAGVLGGCGVSTQALPITPAVTTMREAPLPFEGADAERTMQVSVYLLRRGRLVAVPRTTFAGGASSLLRTLSQGPTGAERRTGLESDVPSSLQASQVAVLGEVVTISVPDGFARLRGTQRVRAIAQIVYTATGSGSTRGVQFTSGGSPVDVPVASGLLVARPVTRADYASLAQ